MFKEISKGNVGSISERILRGISKEISSRTSKKIAVQNFEKKNLEDFYYAKEFLMEYLRQQ